MMFDHGLFIAKDAQAQLAFEALAEVGTCHGEEHTRRMERFLKRLKEILWLVDQGVV